MFYYPRPAYQVYCVFCFVARRPSRRVVTSRKRDLLCCRSDRRQKNANQDIRLRSMEPLWMSAWIAIASILWSRVEWTQTNEPFSRLANTDISGWASRFALSLPVFWHEMIRRSSQTVDSSDEMRCSFMRSSSNLRSIHSRCFYYWQMCSSLSKKERASRENTHQKTAAAARIVREK